MTDALDELYKVTPAEFTALRTELADRAKQHGDAAEAKRIAAARKPTTAAWVVNLLAGTDDVKDRLGDLGERLRQAHAAFDVDRIRELSGEQRRLVDELARAALKMAGLTDPPAAVRDDVTGTIQAAIADPSVTEQLGRLTKAERWSGFGEFGGAAPVFTVVPGGKAKKVPAPAKATPTPTPTPEPVPPDDGVEEARATLDSADATVTAAEQAKAEADDELSERQADLAAARLRADEANKRLADAERKLTAAQDGFDAAKQAAREAVELVKAARAQQKQARAAVAKPRR